MLQAVIVQDKIKNILLSYGDVRISIAIRNITPASEGGSSSDYVYDLDIDSVMLTHNEKGNISELYTHCDDSLIYPEFNIVFELRRIMKFIDEFNRIVG
jgi:hypothetical protein